MNDQTFQIFLAVVPPIAIAVGGALLKMWVDQAVIKRDIDAIAELIGTKRSQARKKRAEKTSEE